MQLTALVCSAICTLLLANLPAASPCQSNHQHPAAATFQSSLPEHINTRVKAIVSGFTSTGGQQRVDGDLRRSVWTLRAQDLFDYLVQVYPDNTVMVMVYPPVTGFDQHAHQDLCGRYLFYFRADEVANVAIAIGGLKLGDHLDMPLAEELLRAASMLPNKADYQDLLDNIIMALVVNNLNQTVCLVSAFNNFEVGLAGTWGSYATYYRMLESRGEYPEVRVIFG